MAPASFLPLTRGLANFLLEVRETRARSVRSCGQLLDLPFKAHFVRVDKEILARAGARISNPRPTVLSNRLAWN